MSSSNDPFCRKWSSHSFNPRERFDAWQAALNASHLGWALERNQRSGFSAEIQLNKLRDLQVVRCVCQPCSGFRGKREISADGSAYYGLLLLHEGKEEVTIGSKRALLEPGSILLWDSTEPIHFKLHSHVYKTTVLVPQCRMEDALPQTRSLVGKTIDWRSGLGAVTSAHITTLGTQAAHIHPLQAHPTAETTLALIATSLGSQETLAGDATRAKFTKKIKSHIEQNLDDPDLDPETLAHRFGISIRYLHQLFAGEGRSVSRFIMDRRLERCRRDLMVAGPHRNITETAFAWGFNDGAHFSRAFKKRFGLSPRAYRLSKK